MNEALALSAEVPPSDLAAIERARVHCTIRRCTCGNVFSASEEYSDVCPPCLRANTANYSRLRITTMNEPVYRCRDCGREYENKGSRDAHQRACRGNLPETPKERSAARPYWQPRREPDVEHRPNMHTFEPDKALPIPEHLKMGDW